jgi:hypothetical protein
VEGLSTDETETLLVSSVGSFKKTTVQACLKGVIMKKRKKEKRNKEAGIQKHHILPKSRLTGKTVKDNIAYIRGDHHQIYHQLFSNMTPDEIVTFLVEFFWNGQWEWVVKSLLEKEARNGKDDTFAQNERAKRRFAKRRLVGLP